MRKSFPDKARVMVFQVCGQNANFWSAFCLHYLNMFWHFVGIMEFIFIINTSPPSTSVRGGGPVTCFCFLLAVVGGTVDIFGY